MQTTDHWTEIRTIHRENHFLYQLMGGAALVLFGILLGTAIFPQDEGYATNLYTEILSIIVTVLILNLLAERREEARRIRDLKAQLVRDAGSRSNEAAKRAIDELRHQGWLTGEDGLLKGEDLQDANLQDSDLHEANLQGANLEGANLQRANLRYANLQEAILEFANLEGADLQEANLQNTDLAATDLQSANLLYADLRNVYLSGVDLRGIEMMEVDLRGGILLHANLQGVNLFGVNFQATNLSFAKLQGADLFLANLLAANLDHTYFDENTVLPDGKHWTSDTDMGRFTDPNHPNFWLLKDTESPE